MIQLLKNLISSNKNTVTDAQRNGFAKNLIVKTENILPDSILFCEKTDLTQHNVFGEEFLCLTATMLLVFSIFQETPQIIHRIDYANVKSAQTVLLTGRGTITIETLSSVISLISFTNAKNEVFTPATEIIKNNLANKNSLGGISFESTTPPPALHDIQNNAVCDICKEPFPAGTTTCPRCSHKGRTFLRIMDFAKPYYRFLALLFLFMLLSTLCGLVTPYISKLFIDFIFKPDAHTGVFTYAIWLFPVVILMFVSYTAQLFLGGVQERFSGTLGYKTVYDVRKAVYKKLQELSLSYFDKHQTGGLLSRVNQDTGDMQRFIVDFFPLTLQSVLLLFGVGVFLLILSWQLTLFMILPIIATVYFGKRIFPKVGLYFNRYFTKRSRLSAFVNDSLSGIRVVKAFGQENKEIEKFDHKSASYRDSGIEMTRAWSVYHPALQFFIMCGGVMVWAIGGHFILQGKMTVGSVVAYSGYLAMFYQPVLTLARMVETLSTSLTAAERVFSIVDATSDVKEASIPLRMPHITGSIEFRNVTFGYNKFKPVIKDLSFTVAKNELVGLVGKSGAGKSTIINLICRLYDVDSGQILVDGIDIRSISIEDLRRQVGIVLQETFLFNGSIYDNIAYARPDATPEQVIDAAIAANVHEFVVAKPDGYDTEVGERGNRLSGGEKQRIAIARAILRDPAILILDEAMSSVDTQTENKIQEALSHLTKNRTTIAIAHRLSTLRSYHRLFVIDNGLCVESGTHVELMQKRGAFFDLVSMQEKLGRIVDPKVDSHDKT